MLLEKVITRTGPRVIQNINLSTRTIHKSSSLLLDDKWRAQKRLVTNINEFGPLTNLPDYSFKDGRPTPFGVRQMIRINKQREYFKKIKQLTSEMDHAVENHNRRVAEKAQEKQRIIDSKLKPKGHLL